MDRSGPALPVTLKVMREYWPGYGVGWDHVKRVFFAWPPGGEKRLEDPEAEGLWQQVRADFIQRQPSE